MHVESGSIQDYIANKNNNPFSKSCTNNESQVCLKPGETPVFIPNWNSQSSLYLQWTHTLSSKNKSWFRNSCLPSQKRETKKNKPKLIAMLTINWELRHLHGNESHTSSMQNYYIWYLLLEYINTFTLPFKTTFLLFFFSQKWH